MFFLIEFIYIPCIQIKLISLDTELVTINYYMHYFVNNIKYQVKIDKILILTFLYRTLSYCTHKNVGRVAQSI